eukprot:TRINITY_DN21529_c0_g1_i1.p1 TRINITY_DN21529_c0_g1~~TRINITY_DN21529_c0_g1_i1.p1  ORF type:complete len:297 (+),score=35.51 TRINITY_DN21529_c0_g1_i1:59-892(+)
MDRTPFAGGGELSLPVQYYVGRCLGGFLRSVYTVDAEGLGRAPARDGGRKWILAANDEPDRAARRAIRQETSRAMACLGYVLGPRTVLLRRLEAMLAGTRIVSPSCGAWPGAEALPSARAGAPALTFVVGVVFDVAVERCRKGQRVAAVNAASAYHSGGGFTTGGRHALEEAMCVQSTLYASLERGEMLAKELGVKPSTAAVPTTARDGKPWRAHLPVDGVLFSPHVEIFRGGTLDGYPFFDVAPAELEAVVSVAMPNRIGPKARRRFTTVIKRIAA